ncbi:hypothetical protein QL285_072705 [Trifolium repens]|nr:hypothetical protein QL285_072705 [Trifolium repens]
MEKRIGNASEDSAGEYSTSSVIIESGPPAELNSIHAGLGVRPDIYGDSQLRLTTLWTAFGSGDSGCSDMICAGFVQVTQDTRYFLGSVMSPTSRVGAPDKYELEFKIQRDKSTGNWWLIVNYNPEVQVGYWPRDMFTHLSTGASKVRFGGETFAAPNTLSPPMGSGRLPQDGYQYSSLFGRIQHIDTDYDQIDVILEYMKTLLRACMVQPRGREWEGKGGEVRGGEFFCFWLTSVEQKRPSVG